LFLVYVDRPDLTVKKRRGGKRMRRLKERFEETALMKQANTRVFSSQAGEYGDDAMGLSRGLLDTDDVAGGNLRRTTEKRKVRQANTKASRKKAAHMEAHAKRQSQSNGLASTISFTPLQGMELVNPDAQKDRVKKANQKWFAESAGFQSALPKRF
jgi:U4/U6 small nuclear ribonucleoprotein PRP31